MPTTKISPTLELIQTGPSGVAAVSETLIEKPHRRLIVYRGRYFDLPMPYLHYGFTDGAFFHTAFADSYYLTYLHMQAFRHTKPVRSCLPNTRINGSICMNNPVGKDKLEIANRYWMQEFNTDLTGYKDGRIWIALEKASGSQPFFHDFKTLTYWESLSVRQFQNLVKECYPG